MPILSKLKPIFKSSIIRPINLIKQSKRNGGGHGGGIEIKYTNYMDILAYDKIHLFSMMAAIPMVLFAGGLSIFVGDAILQDTPEGYEPEDWECERNPVQRLLSRYVFHDSIHEHEWFVNNLAQEQDSIMVKSAIAEVKRQQLRHRDYRAWYFQPTELAELDREDRYYRDKAEHYYNRDAY